MHKSERRVFHMEMRVPALRRVNKKMYDLPRNI